VIFFMTQNIGKFSLVEQSLKIRRGIQNDETENMRLVYIGYV
jgi:hypothetical protein